MKCVIKVDYPMKVAFLSTYVYNNKRLNGIATSLGFSRETILKIVPLLKNNCF